MVECICSLKIIFSFREMNSKSIAISTIRFSQTTSNLYDGGQSALLNQQFALILKTQCGYILIVKWIVSLMYIIGSIVYDHDSDPLMPYKPMETPEQAPNQWHKYRDADLYNKNITMILGISFIVLFRMIETILFFAIMAWSSKRQNFIKVQNTLVQYDDNMIKRYMSDPELNQQIFQISESNVNDGQN